MMYLFALTAISFRTQSLGHWANCSVWIWASRRVVSRRRKWAEAGIVSLWVEDNLLSSKSDNICSTGRWHKPPKDQSSGLSVLQTKSLLMEKLGPWKSHCHRFSWTQHTTIILSFIGYNPVELFIADIVEFCSNDACLIYAQIGMSDIEMYR